MQVFENRPGGVNPHFLEVRCELTQGQKSNNHSVSQDQNQGDGRAAFSSYFKLIWVVSRMQFLMVVELQP